MIFEFDPQKNEQNIAKHKVSFEEAAEIWEDPDLVILPAKKRGERRSLAIGRGYSVLFSVVFTRRGIAIRIISARKSTKKEAQFYEQGKHSK